MGVAKCIVPSCKDKKSRRLRIPHPTADAHDRYWKWLALIQNPVLNSLDPMYVYRNKRICTRHFSPDRFVMGTTKLKRSALPDICIGECHKVIKDRNGKVRDDTLCLNLKESSKDHCTIQDIEIGGDINDPASEDHIEVLTAFSRYSEAAPDEQIVRNSSPIGEDTAHPEPELSLFQSLDSPISPQDILNDWDSDNNNIEESDGDHEDSAHIDGDLPENSSVCDESESTMCHDKGDSSASKDVLADYVKENSLIMFFSKAYQATNSFPQDLQNQIKKGILESIARAQSQYEGL
ncbi:uncharacterized protein [Hetaerina americana]|uniref:uncharacterized protein n=1 Tax=Hetaerina americana TaxID=62018 RepID=UPI003A7F3200